MEKVDEKVRQMYTKNSQTGEKLVEENFSTK